MTTFRKIAAVSLLVLLFTGQGWAATYNIGPGQTYETFTALVAAKTLAAGDIVDGGGNTFHETWTVSQSGTSGHPITLRNAAIDGESTRSSGIVIDSTSFITLSGIVLVGNTEQHISAWTTHDIVADTITTTGGGYTWNCYTSAASYNIALSNITSTGSTGSTAAILISHANNHDISLSHVTVSGSSGRGLYIKGTSNLALNDVEVTGVKAVDPAIYITAFSSGYINLSDLYIGVTRAGVSGANKAIGLALDSITGVTLMATNIISKNNPSSGVLMNSCTFAAGSTFKGYDLSYNSGNGLKALNTQNVVFSSISGRYDGTAKINNNAATGAWFEKSTGTCAGLTLLGTEMSYNSEDGFNTHGGVYAINVGYNCARHNGTSKLNGAGDGFSSHDSDSVNYYYNIATNNELTGFAHTGTSTGTVCNNICWGNGSATNTYSTRGGMYLTSTAATGWTAKNNIIGMNLSYGATGCDVMENATSNNTWSNNLYYPVSDTSFYATEIAPPLSFLSYADAPSAVKTSAVRGDPKLRSTTDFRLRSSSPCINAGATIEGLVTDYDGKKVPYSTAPDIGAYEYRPTVGPFRW